MIDLIKIFFFSNKKYGLTLLFKIVLHEIINIYRLRLFDYVTAHALLDKDEPCVPTPYYILGILKKYVNNQKSVFIDFGCGKGRVIDYMGSFDFEKIIGIENNKFLENYLKRLKNTNLEIIYEDCRNEELLSMLSNTYKENNLILFFYHPFAEKYLNQVVKKFAVTHTANMKVIVVGTIEVSRENYKKYAYKKYFVNSMLSIYEFKIN